MLDRNPVPAPLEEGRAWKGLSEDAALKYEDRMADHWPSASAEAQEVADQVYAESQEPGYKASIMARMEQPDDGQEDRPIQPDRNVRLRMDGRPVDFQKQKVYDWDGSIPMFLNQQEMSLEETTRLVWKVCSDYGVPLLDVQDGRGRSSTAAFRWRTPSGGQQVLMFHSQTGNVKAVSLSIPKFARRPSVVLHEVSHYLVACQFGLAKTAGHGSEFMATMIEVFSRYGTDVDKAHQERIRGYLTDDARSKGSEGG